MNLIQRIGTALAIAGAAGCASSPPVEEEYQPQPKKLLVQEEDSPQTTKQLVPEYEKPAAEGKKQLVPEEPQSKLLVQETQEPKSKLLVPETTEAPKASKLLVPETQEPKSKLLVSETPETPKPSKQLVPETPETPKTGKQLVTEKPTIPEKPVNKSYVSVSVPVTYSFDHTTTRSMFNGICDVAKKTDRLAQVTIAAVMAGKDDKVTSEELGHYARLHRIEKIPYRHGNETAITYNGTVKVAAGQEDRLQGIVEKSTQDQRVRILYLGKDKQLEKADVEKLEKNK